MIEMGSLFANNIREGKTTCWYLESNAQNSYWSMKRDCGTVVDRPIGLMLWNLRASAGRNISFLKAFCMKWVLKEMLMIRFKLCKKFTTLRCKSNGPSSTAETISWTKRALIGLCNNGNFTISNYSIHVIWYYHSYILVRIRSAEVKYKLLPLIKETKYYFVPTSASAFHILAAGQSEMTHFSPGYDIITNLCYCHIAQMIVMSS